VVHGDRDRGRPADARRCAGRYVISEFTTRGHAPVQGPRVGKSDGQIQDVAGQQAPCNLNSDQIHRGRSSPNQAGDHQRLRLSTAGTASAELLACSC